MVQSKNGRPSNSKLVLSNVVNHFPVNQLPIKSMYGRFIYRHLVDFRGFHVSKYTNPMDLMAYGKDYRDHLLRSHASNH